MNGWTAFNPDGTSYWVDAEEAFASMYASISGAEAALGEFVAAAGEARARTTKAERRRAKATLATHRHLLRGLVDSRNSLGALKRRYTGTTTVAAMARELQHSCCVVFCPPPVDMRLTASLWCEVASGAEKGHHGE